jgi:hypothetical protein
LGKICQTFETAKLSISFFLKSLVPGHSPIIFPGHISFLVNYHCFSCFVWLLSPMNTKYTHAIERNVFKHTFTIGPLEASKLKP